MNLEEPAGAANDQEEKMASAVEIPVLKRSKKRKVILLFSAWRRRIWTSYIKLKKFNYKGGTVRHNPSYVKGSKY